MVFFFLDLLLLGLVLLILRILDIWKSFGVRILQFGLWNAKFWPKLKGNRTKVNKNCRKSFQANLGCRGAESALAARPALASKGKKERDFGIFCANQELMFFQILVHLDI